MITAIIPARYASSRFPGKPLALIAGKPMIQHVYERVSQASKVSNVYVATDDERIARVVLDFGGEVIMTDSDLPSGTDRVAAAANEIRADIIVNVQGDEPLISPEIIDATCGPLLSNPELDVATPIIRINTMEELLNPNVAKVVLGEKMRALYFSRSVIPFQRDVPMDEWLSRAVYWKHIGLYAYRRAALEGFLEEEQTELEVLEQLEQLRLLCAGYNITCVEAFSDAIAVDRPEDIARVEAKLLEIV
jgi:3-deoxy-manno-octulosonate cytidylyltransferase (CMP-KDO synthetase)